VWVRVSTVSVFLLFFFFQAEDGIRDWSVTGVQTCDLPIWFVDVPLSAVLTARKPQLVTVLANVRDPGNAGTVMRTSDAAGADGESEGAPCSGGGRGGERGSGQGGEGGETWRERVHV